MDTVNRKHRIYIRNESGSSPFEALVAASALLASLFSLSGQASTPLPAQDTQEYRAQAMTFAQAKLEELKSPAAHATDGKDAPAPGFTREWTVKKDTADSRQFTTLIVGVSWPGALPSQKAQLSLVTSSPLQPGPPEAFEDTPLALRYSPLFWAVATLYLLFRGLPRLLGRRPRIRRLPADPRVISSRLPSAGVQSTEGLRP